MSRIHKNRTLITSDSSNPSTVTCTDTATVTCTDKLNSPAQAARLGVVTNNAQSTATGHALTQPTTRQTQPTGYFERIYNIILENDYYSISNILHTKSSYNNDINTIR